ncbi:hypothetical protein HYH03_006516 [Edaphochlamys debaryana]|uniref:CTLH domain-containing protein n=1 Tax=Edaphochlamys debaryana TaxID=47281 RepID=A0A835Y3I7_9CHLO|nr:hypothetical protein HYH03_006516 [Edaphochlamys debaryana]|eukprot:KAG2495243.1 hypothetical protein HYH03_006516 [Edaphochlamys debaryana]
MAASGVAETLEGPLLRVPFESLKRAAKDRKALIDEAVEHVSALKHPLGSGAAACTPAAPTPAADASGDTEMADASPGPDLASAGPSAATTPAPGARVATPGAEVVPEGGCREASIERLRLLLSQLHGVKRKLGEVSRIEADDCERVRARLEYLSTCRPPPSGVGVDPNAGGLIPWTRQRLDLLLVDHLLRSGYHDTAAKLAATARIQPLADAHVFEAARVVVDALLRDHDCGPALTWCAENRSRLVKIKSSLEFKLHVQQFIELVRREDRLAAITYARTNLAPWASSYMKELQRAVAALAFPPALRQRCAVYRVLFEDSQWRALADLFLKDLYRLNSLTPESLLTVHLQAGLSALKTPYSGEPGGSREDPLRLPAFRRLAAGLPYSKHMHSKLLCAVTKEIMSDANPPFVLPNGMVYSQKGVEQLMAQQEAAAGGGGGGNGKAGGAAGGEGGAGGAGAAAQAAVAAAGAPPGGNWGVCPATGQVFRREELRRAYIA